MGPSPHLLFCEFKIALELQVPMGPRPRLWICESKRLRLVPE